MVAGVRAETLGVHCSTVHPSDAAAAWVSCQVLLYLLIPYPRRVGNART